MPCNPFPGNSCPTTPPRRLRLLKTEGTIPVHYQGAKYNIPILVWIPEHYPLQV